MNDFKSNAYCASMANGWNNHFNFSPVRFFVLYFTSDYIMIHYPCCFLKSVIIQCRRLCVNSWTTCSSFEKISLKWKNKISGQISHSDQWSYIKIETLQGKNPIKIPNAIFEVVVIINSLLEENWHKSCKEIAHDVNSSFSLQS